MSRLSDHDKEGLQDLVKSLLVLRLDEPSSLRRAMNDLRVFLGTDFTAAWGVVNDACGLRLAFSTDSRKTDSDEPLASWLRESTRECGITSESTAPGWIPRQASQLPWRIVDSIEDVQVRHEPPSGSTPPIGAYLERAAACFRPSGIDGLQELRLLVCGGPSLLAWIGAFQRDLFSERQHLILKALVPALQRRITVERSLQTARVTEIGFGAALEAIGRPAYVVDSEGRIRQANRAGHTFADGHSAQVGADLALALAGQPAPVDISLLDVEAADRHYLVVYRDAPEDPATRLAAVGSRWKLTRRQRAVVEHLVLGETNKSIAARLGCVESTVELHLTQILARANVESRAALIAKFWRER